MDHRLEQGVQGQDQTLERLRPYPPFQGHSLKCGSGNKLLARSYKTYSPSGTKQSSKTSSHVSLPLIPTLSNFWWVEKPLYPFSIMNVVIPLDPFSGDVFAYTTSVDATGPFVILHRSRICQNPLRYNIVEWRTRTYCRLAHIHHLPLWPSTSCSLHHSHFQAHSLLSCQLSRR